MVTLPLPIRSYGHQVHEVVVWVTRYVCEVDHLADVAVGCARNWCPALLGFSCSHPLKCHSARFMIVNSSMGDDSWTNSHDVATNKAINKATSQPDTL